MSEVAALPRILTIMGSGETAPTMVKVHRSILDRLGPSPKAVVLDTPFGFQENADELVVKIVNYFSESLRTTIEVASTRGGSGGAGAEAGSDPFASERLHAQLRDASYVFAGPGSPTYALRQWTGTVVPALLREHLEQGGAVTFASAAALTLGLRTLPVYEIYKVGAQPSWEVGLDLISAAGLAATVIPHYNNAEGGTHDTRFCYLGERRLSVLERELPEGSFVLGVDEHTALVLDLDARTASVVGNGVVTVRAAGRSKTFASGETVGIDELAAAAAELAEGGAAARATRENPTQSPTDGPGGVSSEGAPATAAYAESPLLAIVREKEAAFAAALAGRDVKGAVGAMLELEAEIAAWSQDIPAGDALDRARASLRSLIVELGSAAEGGLRDPRETLGPFVDAMLELRKGARADKRFADADGIRERLTDLGVEVRDTPDGSEWLLVGGE